MGKNVDVAIIGAGSAGLFALSKVRHVTDSYVLIDGGELGTTCARVGCMPSKVAIQVGEDFHRRGIYNRIGIEGGDGLSLNKADAMEHVQDLRDVFVDQVLMGSTDEMGDEFIEGYAKFTGPTTLEVNGEAIAAKKVVIATGSRPVVPAAWKEFGDKILTTDTFFEEEDLPESMAVIGMGVVGLELGQALHRMGVQVTGIDQLDTIGGLQDPVINQAAIEIIGKEMPLWLGQPAVITAAGDKLRVTAGEQSVVVDKVLAAMGRTPNVASLNLEALGVALDERGLPAFNPNTMQVADLPVFIAGDVDGERPILHEAGTEGRIAGYNAMQEAPVAFKRQTPLAITFCDPNIAVAGAALSELDADAIAIGEMKFNPLGRALIMGKNKGLLRVYADKVSGKVLGGAMLAPGGEHIAHLLAWAITQDMTVFDMLRMPFYHPCIEEGLQAALNNLRDQIEQRPESPVELERM